MTYGTGRAAPLWAFLFAVLVLLACAGAGRAQAEALTVEGVEVDVTADSAQAARDSALNQGQRKAFEQLMQRLVQPKDQGRIPKVSDAQIADMVLDFDIASEQTSAVRYIGKLNFRFDGGMVRGLLGSYNLAYDLPADMSSGTAGPAAPATGAGGRVVVLPVFSTASESRLFDSGSLWRDAWTMHPPQVQGIEFILPRGDPDDLAAVDAESALLGDRDRLAAIAQRYGTDSVIVAETRLQKDTAGLRVLAIQAQRFGPAGLEDTFRDQVPATGSDYDPIFGQAVQRVAAHTRDSWKQGSPVIGAANAAVGPEQSIHVSVPIRSLNDWLDVQKRLSQVPAVTHADVVSMLRTEVRLDLYHTGDAAQLTTALAQSQLVLSPAPTPGWWLLHPGY
jgi:hypothetical protein